MSKARTPAQARFWRVPHPIFIAFLAVFGGSWALLRSVLDATHAPLIGFDIAAILFILGQIWMLASASPDMLRRIAAINDGGRTLMLMVASVVTGVVLVVVGLELSQANSGGVLQIALSLSTLVLAWLFGNMVYAVHYAHLFYDSAPTGKDCGGLDFPGGLDPDFWDFCYFSFVLGMTFQVSDVEITNKRIRRTATVHSLIAFFFNIGVLALSVNVVAGASG